MWVVCVLNEVWSLRGWRFPTMWITVGSQDISYQNATLFSSVSFGPTVGMTGWLITSFLSVCLFIYLSICLSVCLSPTSLALLSNQLKVFKFLFSFNLLCFLYSLFLVSVFDAVKFELKVCTQSTNVLCKFFLQKMSSYWFFRKTE